MTISLMANVFYERKKKDEERKKEAKLPMTGMTEVLLDPGTGDFKSVGKKRADRSRHV